MIYDINGNTVVGEIPSSVKDYGAAGDGVTDDTNAIQTAINNESVVYFPSGTYLFSSTIVVPDGRYIYGSGSAVLKLTSTSGLQQNAWRTTYRYPYIYVGANCIVENITVRGCDTIDYRNHNAIEMHGDNSVCKNVHTYNTNYFPDAWVDDGDTEQEPSGASGYRMNDESVGSPGYGIFVFNADNVQILGGTFIGNGYQGIGTEDADNVIISGCYVGDSLRTGIQAHRGSTNIKILNCTVNNNYSHKHADITLHGSSDNPIDGVLVDGCRCVKANERTGVFQTVWGYEKNIVISNCHFKARKKCAYIHAREYGSSDPRAEKIIINSNVLESGDVCINIRGNNSVISSNILKGGTTKIVETGTNIVKYANLELATS